MFTKYSLVYRHIDNNAIDWLPDEIGELPYLTVLNINGNHLTELPAAIGRLQELLKLQVSSNLLASLPKGKISLLLYNLFM